MVETTVQSLLSFAKCRKMCVLTAIVQKSSHSIRICSAVCLNLLHQGGDFFSLEGEVTFWTNVGPYIGDMGESKKVPSLWDISNEVYGICMTMCRWQILQTAKLFRGISLVQTRGEKAEVLGIGPAPVSRKQSHGTNSPVAWSHWRRSFSVGKRLAKETSPLTTKTILTTTWYVLCAECREIHSLVKVFTMTMTMWLLVILAVLAWLNGS